MNDPLADTYRKACAADAPYVHIGQWVCLHCGAPVALNDRRYPTTHRSTYDAQLAALMATVTP